MPFCLDLLEVLLEEAVGGLGVRGVPLEVLEMAQKIELMPLVLMAVVVLLRMLVRLVLVLLADSIERQPVVVFE
jgi:hypothetical protein